MTNARERKYVVTAYSLLSARLFVDQMFNQLLPSALLNLIELGIMAALVAAVAMYIYLYKPFRYGRWMSILFFFLALISAYAIIRGKFTDGLKGLFFAINGEYRGLAYILPFIILPLPNVKYFRSILEVFFYSSLLAIPLWLLNMGSLVQASYHAETIGAFLPFFAAFLLGLLRRFSPRKKIATATIYTIFFLLMLLNARRNVILSLGLYMVIAFASGFFSEIRKDARKAVTVVISALLLAFVGVFGLAKSERLMSNLLERGLEDTRSQVELFFLADLTSSPVSDIILGRGMDGTYYQITTDEESLEVNTDRPIIETGYLNMVLKGGIVYVLVVLIIQLCAISSGLKSHNRDLRFIAAILIVYLLDNYTTNPICIFNVRSIIFWFSVSVCLQHSQVIRNIREYRRIHARRSATQASKQK